MDEHGDPSLVLETITKTVKALTTTKRLWIGFSGGLDSHVLLDLIVRAFQPLPDYHIGAIHVHHGISPFADSWVQHCERVCTELKIPLQVLQVDGRVTGGRSPEEVAREARFAALEKCLQPEDCLLLAHHELDQTETILLRLFRGCGPLGLSGMPAKAALGQSQMIRPLLTTPKEVLLQYAAERQLKWIEDDSNHNTQFDRNFLRHEILPHLSNRWPKVARSINRTGALCKETALLVQELASKDLESVMSTKPNVLSVKRLLQLEPRQRHGVLRHWLQLQGCAFPSHAHMERIDREVLQAKPGAKPMLKISDYLLRRVRDELSVTLLLPLVPLTVPMQ